MIFLRHCGARTTSKQPPSVFHIHIHIDIVAAANTVGTDTTTMSVQTKATIASFGGKLLKLAHNASSTNCEMAFNLYLPPQAATNPLHKVPVLIYLSGLTCTGDNCAEKGFFQHRASQKGIAVVYPDTSPREHAASYQTVSPSERPQSTS